MTPERSARLSRYLLSVQLVLAVAVLVLLIVDLNPTLTAAVAAANLGVVVTRATLPT